MSMLKYILCVGGLSAAVGGWAVLSEPTPPAPAHPFNAPTNVDMSKLYQAFRH